MLPLPESVHIDRALTNISIGFKNSAFIGERVFPTIPVTKMSDKFFKFLKGAWFRNEARKRGPGARGARSGYHVTTDNFSCVERALAHPIPIELINNADLPLRPWETGVNFATNGVLLAKEIDVATVVLTSGNWTSSEDVDAGWADDTSCTFIEDILNAKETIRKRIGRYPNVLILDAGTFNAIQKLDELLQRIKYGAGASSDNPAMVTERTLAALFGLDEVLIGGAIYSSDEETMAGTEFTAVNIWEVTATKGSAFLYYRDPNPGIETPNSGAIFNWRGDAGQLSQVVAGGPYRTVRKWWEDAEKQWVVEASEYYDVKACGPDGGHLFYDTIVT